MQPDKILISKKNSGSRLDKFLAEKFPAKSRSFLKKLIEGKKITVNDKNVKASYNLQMGDLVEINFPQEEKIRILPEKIKLGIIYEDKDIIIVNKPAGMVVHPDITHTKSTLVNALIHYHPAIKNVGEKKRPGIVHRLDKDTSGLIICAKNDYAYKYLVDKFKKREIVKKYYALVFGKVKEKRGVISYSLGKAKGRHLKISIKPDKEALTKYRVLRYFLENGKYYTLLEVTPKTGRTHQIRVHLSKIGYPIAGDPKYRHKKLEFPFPLDRQFLHAFYLEFVLPSGKKKIFKISLPEDLEKIIMKLQGH